MSDTDLPAKNFYSLNQTSLINDDNSVKRSSLWQVYPDKPFLV